MRRGIIRASSAGSEAGRRRSAMRFRNREERERYMDGLERQIEHQREQMQRTLDRMEGSTRRREALKSKLRSSLHSLPGRVKDVGERGETADRRQESEAPRSWWEFWR